ncbi:uncharacterized protein V1510DRAFT_393187 [Dipodascopsis tothii]|uniref:uncharacterized protein n=1 Tax=Dipodascopsis tothii TaxID=44089 RepID=UPI0034CD0A34
MVLEATMIVIDNSEYMRNGDYTPTRFEAQADSVNLIFSAKTQSNPESAVGLMTMGGKGPEVLVTLTTDLGKILSAIVQAKVQGEAHLVTGIQVAALALKHRQNKSQRQRIIVFVGSPIHESEKELLALAKKMKKNNVSVDFINFGDVAENADKLEKFVAAVNSDDNSHLLSVAPGPHLLSDEIASSNILVGEDGMPSAAGGADAGEVFEFGVNPNLEPELALALRMSLEDERARQERAAQEAQVQPTIAEEDEAGEAAAADAPAPAPDAPDAPAPDAPGADKMNTD